jgi:hypothetical protein
MTFTSITQWVLSFHRILHPLTRWLQQTFRTLLRPHPTAMVRGAFFDLTYTKAELMAKNALLRHQLGILHRQVKRPQHNRRDRIWMLLLANGLRHGIDALLIIQPET